MSTLIALRNASGNYSLAGATPSGEGMYSIKPLKYRL
jgi:hypothetical protein